MMAPNCKGVNKMLELRSKVKYSGEEGFITANIKVESSFCYCVELFIGLDLIEILFFRMSGEHSRKGTRGKQKSKYNIGRQ